MRQALILLCAFVMLTSCQRIILTFYGIKQPNIEQRRTIVKKAHKLGLDTTNIVTLNSSDFLSEFKGKGFPDCDIYDKNGRYIEYRETDSSCNAGLFQFIPDLRTDKEYKQPEHADLATVWKKLRDMNGNQLESPEPADFYVLMYWTVWIGRLNKDHVKVWEDLARNNTHCKVKVVKVNLDFQEYWGKGEQERIVNAMRRKK